jgi:SpoVK/Ycf46/Vps4 family AAA+-type ATPase
MNNLGSFIPMVHNIRALEPDRPILAVIEDLYEFLCNNSRDKFLNLLDGNMQVDGIFYLATTNFVKDLPASITNRPSRFDRLVEIKFPTAEARRIYIIKKLKPHDAERIGAEMIEKMVKDTEGMSFSHLKELITAFVVMESDYNETIKRLQTMNTATYEY